MHHDRKYPVPAVSAIILQDDSILLVQRGAEPARGRWSAPGGSVEIGETLSDAVRREVLEETGLEVKVGALAGVTDIIIERDAQVAWHYILITFLASIESGKICAASDVSDCRWVKLSDIRAYDVTKSLLDRLEEMGMISA